MSNKYLKVKQPCQSVSRGSSHCRSRASLPQWTCKSRGLPGKSRAWSAADFPQWRLQRHHNKFPLPACVSAQRKSVLQQLSDAGSRKAFTRSPWFSASQNSIAHHAPVLMKWPRLWALSSGRGCAVQAPQPSSAPPWCLAGVGEDHYFTIWNAKQICFNWIQCWW